MAPECLPGPHTVLALGLSSLRASSAKDCEMGRQAELQDGKLWCAHSCPAPWGLTPESDLHPLPCGGPWGKVSG